MYWALYGYNKSSIYKLWRLDIWGIYRSRYYKQNRLANFLANLGQARIKNLQIQTSRLLYRMYERPLLLQQTRFLPKEMFLLRLNLFYFLSLSPNYFRKMLNRAVSHVGSMTRNYMMFLEGRLLSFVYRTNLITNVFMLRFWVNYGVFTVNGKLHGRVNKLVNLYECLSVRTEMFATMLMMDMCKRLFYEVLWFSVPKYIHVNWRLFFAYMWRYPRKQDLAYPLKKINLYRGGNIIRKFT
jgi:hypothetical protein